MIMKWTSFIFAGLDNRVDVTDYDCEWFDGRLVIPCC